MTSLSFDRDVIVHLGSFRNVALFHRGVYHLRLQLRTEGEPGVVPPSGFFSCPPAAVCDVLSTSRIDDEAFSTRSFIVRFRDEEHVLNEGCSFRAESMNALESSRMLLTVELHFCPLVSSKAGAYVIPSDPSFTVLVSQTLCIQKASTLHELHPVRFKDQQVDLEVYLHCDITRFCYSNLRLTDVLGQPETVWPNTRRVLSESEASRLTESLVKPALTNHSNLQVALGPILRAYCGLGKDEADNLNQRLKEAVSIGFDLIGWQQRVVGDFREQEAGVEKELLALIERLNAESCALYALVFSILPCICGPLFVIGRRAYREQLRGYWGCQVLTQTVAFEEADWAQVCDEKQLLDGLKCRIIAEEEKASGLARNLSVFDTDFHRFPLKLPKALLQSYSAKEQPCIPTTLPPSPPRPCGYGSEEEVPLSRHHVIVLQHGFLGNSYDMRLMRNSLALDMSTGSETDRGERFHYLCASSNDENNQDSIEDMAARLAQEVATFILDKVPHAASLGDNLRVSFVGHSLGGLVIRCALEDPALSFIRKSLHCYASLATPHLGTIYSASPLVSAGMRALWQYQRSPALQQLVLEDGGGDGSVAASRIYKLSENTTLRDFRHVVVVAALKDQYVPLRSARMQVDDLRASRDAKHGATVVQMAQNLFAQIGDPTKLVRVTLELGSTEDFASVDVMIGRAAHISYLEHTPTAVLVAHILAPFLCSTLKSRSDET